jgi:hypothetical protein
MNLEDHEIRITYFALKVAKKQMELELETKRGIPPADFAEAEKELLQLTTLFDSVTAKYNKLVSINPFSRFPNVFFPEL